MMETPTARLNAKAMIFNRLFILILLLAFLQHTFFAQTIADARAQPLGNTVTVRGIVTNGSELGKVRYLQDGTGGIAAFPGTGSVAGFDGTVFPGDSIEVTGTMVSYHGLLEITPITSFNIISTGNTLPSPKSITLSQISDNLESQLVEFECISFGSAGGTFNNGGSFGISDSEGATAKIYLNSAHPIVGNGIPSGPIRLRAILSEYDDYQLLPRNGDDFVSETCFYFPQKLEQSDIGTTGFQLTWETSLPSNCTLRVGTNATPNNDLPVPGYTADHSYLITNLIPGTIYWVQIEARHNGQTILSEPIPFATQSLSSGEIKTYFNHSIDLAFANGYIPNGTSYGEVLEETIARIDGAQQTLDLAIYNNNRSDITNAVKAAHARGVQVRYIAAIAASNPALDPAPPFPLLYGNDLAIMHNKFMVIDADIPDKAWVMSGSLNWTNQNIVTDFNNTLFIQDQSLARAYEIEFEEMWGSDGLQPNLLESRFGPVKLDNTPHRFIIGGYPVESYFSPSDQTTSRIEAVLRSAQSEALFALFSFTKNELGNALVDIHDTGVPVRGIMENINDSGAEYAHLLNNGVNVRHHNLTGEFHHKYSVVDANEWTSDPTVVTGSHNWSTAAETTNDENTLVLHHPVIATLFKAEFEKRWGEFPSSVFSHHGSGLSIFPNPASDFLVLRGLPDEEGVFWIKNSLGQVLLSENRGTETQSSLNIAIAGLKPGQYFLTFVSDHAIASIPFQKI
ncbi:MAG: phospholipase D-like domain-containing protein [Saprospiraceae bacterium]